MEMQIYPNNQLIFGEQNFGGGVMPQYKTEKASKLKEHSQKNLHLPHSK